MSLSRTESGFALIGPGFAMGYCSISRLTVTRLCGARADGFEIAVDFALPLHQVVVHLQPEKEAFRQPEIPGEPKVSVGSDVALAQHDLIDPAWRDVYRASQRVLTEPHRLKELFEQDFARMRVLKQPALCSRFRHAWVLSRKSLNAKSGRVFLLRFPVWTFGPSRNDVIGAT